MDLLSLQIFFYQKQTKLFFLSRIVPVFLIFMIPYYICSPGSEMGRFNELETGWLQNGFNCVWTLIEQAASVQKQNHTVKSEPWAYMRTTMINNKEEFQ